MNIPGVPYALASSIVDFPANEIITSAAKINSCKLSTNPKFFTFSYFLFTAGPETKTMSRS